MHCFHGSLDTQLCGVGLCNCYTFKCENYEIIVFSLCKLLVEPLGDGAEGLLMMSYRNALNQK